MPEKQIHRHGLVLGLWFAIALAFHIALAAQSIHRLLLHSHSSHGDAVAWILTFVLQVVTPLLCLSLGFYAAYQRPWDQRAWLLLVLLVSYAVFAIGTDTVDSVMSWPLVIRSAALVYRTFWVYSWPVWMILFAIYFPERSAADRRWPWMKWVVLTPVIALCVIYMIIRVLRNESIPRPRILQTIEPVMALVLQDLFWFTIAVCLGLWVARLSEATGADARRRLRILFFGVAISFVPVILVDLLEIQILSHKWSDVPLWTLLLAALPMALFPVTLGHVTVVERALDLGVLIRQSLQYALARRGVLAMRIVVSTGVVLVVAMLSGGLPLGLRMLLTAAGIWLVLLVGVGSERAACWIDRRFFREAYNAEQVLQQLAEQVTIIVGLTPLLETVTHRVAAALHITKLAIFLDDNNLYRAAAVLGFPEVPDYAFAGDTDTVRQLRIARKPLPVYLDDPGSWAQQIQDSESQAFRELEAQLLVPITRRSEMLGFLAFGPKISEAPYSPTDLQLLQSVASQTGFAVENSRLTTAIAVETAEREVLNRELAIAREVQQRLFPQERPSIPGVELVGVCRPAREVGGDYYDFFALPGNVLGLAIGDVSGKGVPASLLMASLQASLRGQTLAGAADINQLVTNVNSLVYGASSVNRYATFFYAQYSPSQRLLTYVNAGHNPPVLLRKHSAAVRLEAGGPPVGLLPATRYEGASIQIEPGDLLLLFSDGISEAMNEQDEEWGEENMLGALQTCSSTEPAGIAKALFDATDAFTGLAPQHDDMTLVVVRFSV